MKGDFNGHVGAGVEDGIDGNHHVNNWNGDRFLQFLDDIITCHLNGACCVTGDRETKIAKVYVLVREEESLVCWTMEWFLRRIL